MSGGRRRLDHIDAMRPIKQAGVLTNHTILAFTAASPAVSSVLLLLHVSREGFFFVSACMLTYAYRDLDLRSFTALRHFYRRRFIVTLQLRLDWRRSRRSIATRLYT